MTLKPPELELKTVRVTIQMKPISSVDKYVKVPTQDDILEDLAVCIRKGELDHKFLITITPEE